MYNCKSKFCHLNTCKNLSFINNFIFTNPKIQSVSFATEISLIILPLMRILKWNLKRTTDTFLFISHTTNVLLFKFRCHIFIGVRIIKEMPDSVASGTLCRIMKNNDLSVLRTAISLTQQLFPHILTKDISLGCTSQTPNREPSLSTGDSVIIVCCTYLSQMAPQNRFPFTAEPDTLTFTLMTSNYKFRCSFACCYAIFYTL